MQTVKEMLADVRADRDRRQQLEQEQEQKKLDIKKAASLAEQEMKEALIRQDQEAYHAAEVRVSYEKAALEAFSKVDAWWTEEEANALIEAAFNACHAEVTEKYKEAFAAMMQMEAAISAAEAIEGVSRLAYKFAMRYKNIAALNGAVDVDDLKQCAFLGFYEAVQGFDPLKGTFSTMLSYGVRHACRRALGMGGKDRAEYHSVSLEEPIPGADDLTLADTIPDEDTAFERSEMRSDIEKALQRLPYDMSRVIHLHDLGGRTIEEAAAALGCDRETASKWRRTGFQQLRRDRGLRAYHEPVRLRYKGVRAFLNDWTSVVEEEVIRRLDRQ